MRSWIGFNSGIQGIKYKGIIVAVADNKCDDSAVIQVKDGAEIQLVYIGSFVPLKLCYICQPLFIGHTCVELTVKPVLCNVLGISSLPCTAVILVLNGGLNIQSAENTKHSLLVHIQLVVVCQIVLDTAVTFIRVLCMDLLHNFCNLFVF